MNVEWLARPFRCGDAHSLNEQERVISQQRLGTHFCVPLLQHSDLCALAVKRSPHSLVAKGKARCLAAVNFSSGQHRITRRG